MTPVDGQVILIFRCGELVAIDPIADSDEQAKALLQQVEKAAAAGELTEIKGGND